jgi:hypothetical protein
MESKNRKTDSMFALLTILFLRYQLYWMLCDKKFQGVNVIPYHG